MADEKVALDYLKRERMCRILCEDLGHAPDEVDEASRLPLWALWGDTVDRMMGATGIPATA